ncbi:unnamed protein product [Adineta ricciae]|uniref:SS18 N-terminal domain-containing protein n=1 Tax=Adineta ricciae TaxID=249248 RepID=A0A814EL45_ADIRI|nr:unnamed protein product [Adineta ricciae]CAF0994515.1 unnamed protein product [Adineta ricciae]
MLNMYSQQQYSSPTVVQTKPAIQKLLDDNSQLIIRILDLQAKGKQTESLEYQRTLYQNLNYLIQFDPTTSHYHNNLPSPDMYSQTQSSIMNGSSMQQSSSEQTTERNLILGYRPQTTISSSSNENVNAYSSSHLSTKPTISQQHNYGQYPVYQQQNIISSSKPSVNAQQGLYSTYNERQQGYHPQQNYLMQQQWQSTSHMPIQQQTSNYHQ